MKNFKMKTKEDKCYWEAFKPWSFLWWKGIKQEFGYTHNWVYKDKEHRKCKDCGAKEMLYLVEYWDGYRCEDWRASE
jgi:hypothetical protein